MATATELLDRAIADLEARLGLKPNQSVGGKPSGGGGGGKKQGGGKPKNKGGNDNNKNNKTEAAGGKNETQPDICKLEFKVGQIVKVWNHPEADKLYCEEIDVGEEAPRQIASGLRPHFTLEQMEGQRLLVVSNLKAKNLVKFKSHGMVLCAAAATADGGEKVEFVEPPADAKIGEVVRFEGLPTPEPWPQSQVEKKKVFAACMDGMKTTDDCVAAWNGHAFMTSAGPCKTKSIASGAMR
jgi:aminoacyl tRNA synthase complex-interacting multifunctional protein 1